MAEYVKGAADPFANHDDMESMIEAVPWYCYMTRTFAGTLSQHFAIEQYDAADARMLLITLAAKRYQLAHGQLPERLDDLVPAYIDAVPADPYDGHPVRYKLTDTGATVYCVYEDGIDNGGTEMKADGAPFDIVVKLLK